ncbi:MAG: hypothetical protein ACOC2Y_00235 [Spirochaetota bacterium]
MRTKRLRGRVWVLVAAVTVVLAGCTQPTGDDGGGDTTGPSFAGVETVSANGLTRATLSWQPATDEASASADIRYEVWQADVNSISTTTTPALTTSPGATSAELTVPGFREQFFLVQAVDEAGNRDGNTVVDSITTTQAIWNRIDGGGENGVNETEVLETRPVLESVGGELYAAWVDQANDVLRVSRYDGDGTTGDWTAVDDGGVSIDTSVTGEPVALRAFEGRLYAAWIELLNDGTGQSSSQVRVGVYDPADATAGWTIVDGTPTGGLNRDETNNGSQVRLAVAGDTLYAVWVESFLSTNLYAAAYDGDDSAPSWTDLGGDLEYDSVDIPREPDAVGFEGDLIVVWEEDSAIRAKVYDPGADAWSPFEGGGTGLNYDSGSTAYSPRLAVAGDELYLVWTEDDADFNVQVRARVRDAGGWPLIDGGGAAGLNFGGSVEGVLDAPAPFALNGVLYVAFAEKDATDIARLRVVAYNGDATSPDWQFVDGAASGGLNPSSTYEAEYPAAAGHNGSLVVTWIEEVGAVAELFDVRVIRGR